MEALFYLIVLLCFCVCITLLMLRERKTEKRIWEWRERLIEAISMNTVSIEEVVKALMYEK